MSTPAIGDTGVCQTCRRPITYLTVTDPGFLPRTGWRDNFPRDSLVCFSAGDYAHRPVPTACEHHDFAGYCTEECVTLVNQMSGDGYTEPMVYGDYLGGESSVDRSGCHAPAPQMIEYAALDTERRAVVWVQECPYEDEHDAMPCPVCTRMGE